MALLARVGQFAKAVGEFDATSVYLETFGDAWVGGFVTRQRRFRRGVFEQYSQTPLPQIWFDIFDQYLAEDIRPGVVVRDPHPVARRRRQSRTIALTVRDGGQQIDPGKAPERRGHGHQFRLGEWISGPAAKRKLPDAGGLRGMGDNNNAVRHHRVVTRIGAIPFQHGEFGKMQIAALFASPAASNFLQANSGEVLR